MHRPGTGRTGRFPVKRQGPGVSAPGSQHALVVVGVSDGVLLVELEQDGPRVRALEALEQFRGVQAPRDGLRARDARGLQLLGALAHGALEGGQHAAGEQRVEAVVRS